MQRRGHPEVRGIDVNERVQNQHVDDLGLWLERLSDRLARSNRQLYLAAYYTVQRCAALRVLSVDGAVRRLK
jgi:hypothetical protein